MIKWERVESKNDLKFQGFEITDFSDKSIQLKDISGKMVRIEYDTFSLVIKTPHINKEKRWVITGQWKGLKFSDDNYESEFQARNALKEIGRDFDGEFEKNFKIEQVEIEAEKF